MEKRNIIFVLGKGGVGKTTVSALISLYFSSNRRVEVYSFDQAHNLGDVLHMRLDDNPQLVKENLYAAEVDVLRWKKRYMAQMRRSVKAAYTYLSAYNMLEVFDIMEDAPDIEQLSLLLAFDEIRRRPASDLTVIDMPPTALALEFFRVVDRNIRWIEALIDLREKIQQKKEIISRIRLGSKEIETDKVLKRLRELHEFYIEIKNVLHNSFLLVVQNPDEFSRLEAARIVETLGKMGYDNYRIVDNKAEKPADWALPVFSGDIMRDFDKLIAQNIDFFLFVEKAVFK